METVTFYSYKGGSGRSLLLANTAQFLALAGKRVVALDLDFEAPGLHYKLSVGEPGQRTADIVPTRGVVDYLKEAFDGPHPERLADYLMPVALPDGSGTLSLMPAGAAPTGEYWRTLTALVRRGVLNEPSVDLIASLVELKLRIEDELEADFLLIDSRTGITELAGLATTLLADKVVCLMLDNPESLAGTRAILRSFGRAVRFNDQGPVEVLPVLSRVPLRNPAGEQRVLAFLNEPAPAPDVTLAYQHLFVLPIEPEVAYREHILLGAERVRDSDLRRSYLELMRALTPIDPDGIAAFIRQRAVKAMHGWFWNWGRRALPDHPLALLESVRIPLTTAAPEHSSLFADVAVIDYEASESGPAAVGQYVAELSASEDWRTWEFYTAVPLVVLFCFDEHDEIATRIFERDTETRKLTEIPPD